MGPASRNSGTQNLSRPHTIIAELPQARWFRKLSVISSQMGGSKLMPKCKSGEIKQISPPL